MNFQSFSNTHIGIGSGILGGLGRYLLDISSISNIDTLIVRTAVAASVSAACGLVIKEIHGWVKRKIKH